MMPLQMPRPRKPKPKTIVTPAPALAAKAPEPIIPVVQTFLDAMKGKIWWRGGLIGATSANSAQKAPCRLVIGGSGAWELGAPGVAQGMRLTELAFKTVQGATANVDGSFSQGGIRYRLDSFGGVIAIVRSVPAPAAASGR